MLHVLPPVVVAIVFLILGLLMGVVTLAQVLVFNQSKKYSDFVLTLVFFVLTLGIWYILLKG